VNEIFTDCFKYVKLHIYLPCQQSLYNNCSSFDSFFTDGHHWTFMKVILWYCFFALILHKGMSSRSWGLTRTKFPTFTVLHDVHGDVLKRRKKEGLMFFGPIVREDDWILYVNNFKCVEQSNFNMSRPPIELNGDRRSLSKESNFDKVVVVIGVTKLLPNSLHKSTWLLHRLHLLACLASKEFHNTISTIICISSCKGYAPLTSSSKQQEVKYEMFHKIPPICHGNTWWTFLQI
jgi:hypothetical protein